MARVVDRVAVSSPFLLSQPRGGVSVTVLADSSSSSPSRTLWSLSPDVAARPRRVLFSSTSKPRIHTLPSLATRPSSSPAPTKFEQFSLSKSALLLSRVTVMASISDQSAEKDEFPLSATLSLPLPENAQSGRDGPSLLPRRPSVQTLPPPASSSKFTRACLATPAGPAEFCHLDHIFTFSSFTLCFR